MKMKLLTTMLLMAVTLCSGCRADNSPEATLPQDSKTKTEAAESSPAQENTDVPADDTAADAAEETENEETVQFIVDITDNLVAENGMVIGNTSSTEAYSGIIEIYLSDPLIEKAKTDIQVGQTYLFTAAPMMTMSIPPQITALEYTQASESDIAALEEARSQVSNFKECMTSYETMSLEEIIQDGNFNYALWTQDEIREYKEFLAQKGYTEDSTPKSYARTREELGGSVPGDAMQGKTE